MGLKTGQNRNCLFCGKLMWCQPHQVTKKYCSKKCYSDHKCLGKICKKCIICYSEFYCWPSVAENQKCCSAKCSYVVLANIKRTGYYKNCFFCNKEMYIQVKQTKKYCSRNCAANGLLVESIKLICKECGNSFYRKPHQIHENTKFCSVKCSCRYNNKTGKPFIRKNNTKPEQLVKALLEDLKLQYRPTFKVNYENTAKFYDIFIPSLNTLIEVDGIYWHAKNLKRSEMNDTQIHNRKNDILKNKIAKKLGYKLCRIWSDEISKEKLQEIL